MDEILTQIYLLIDCINKKLEALETVMALTNAQTIQIMKAPNDNASFAALVSRKKEVIDHINDLDSIFESIYKKIKDFMGKGNAEHRQPMLELQSKIVEVTDISVKIKTTEEKNMRILTGGVRRPPKKIVNSNHAVIAYKKNKKF